MATATLAPKVTSADRLGLTLFFAAAVHAIVILGISFELSDGKDEQYRPPPLEITLVHSESEKPPEKADYLAQTNQAGGGTVKEKMRPSSPFPNPLPIETQGDAAQSSPAASPSLKPQSERQVLTTNSPSQLTAERVTSEQRPELPELPDAEELMRRSREIARLSAEIRQKHEAYAQQPRHKYITANTREYTYAAYEDAWRLKVERIGNLNYPDEAKRRNLSGSLVLDVLITADGSVREIKLVRSSGHKVLDDGARRIVQLAAPFAPFSEAMRKETDVLHIVRVWQFESENRFQTSR